MKLSSLIFLVLLGCARDTVTEIQVSPYIIPEPSITLTPKLIVDPYGTPGKQSDYVIAIGTIENRYGYPLCPVSTELRFYFDSTGYAIHAENMIANGRIGFFGANYLDGLSYVTDTLRVSQRMYHYTKSDGFYWGGGPVYYDFRIVIGGIATKRSGMLYEKDFVVPVTRRVWSNK